jgi:hypothetical protein
LIMRLSIAKAAITLLCISIIATLTKVNRVMSASAQRVSRTKWKIAAT